MARSRHSPISPRDLRIRGNGCGKPPGLLGKNPGQWGKSRSIRTANTSKSHKTWAATRQAGNSTRLAQGAGTERVVGVGVRGVVMLMPCARGVVVPVGMLMTVVVVVVVGMGMAAHR